MEKKMRCLGLLALTTTMCMGQCIPKWESNRAIPVPSNEISFQAPRENFFCGVCSTEENYLVVKEGIEYFYICRCKRGLKRSVDSDVCIPCFLEEICPEFSDFAFDSAICTTRRVDSLIPDELKNYVDPHTEPPCIFPLKSKFSPSVPFYFASHTRIQIESRNQVISLCANGLRPFNPSSDRRIGLVWTVATLDEGQKKEINIPVLAHRLFLTEADLRDLTDVSMDDFVRRNGNILRPVESPTCVLCEAGFFCKNGESKECEREGSVVIGAEDNEQCAYPAPNHDVGAGCPKNARRLREGGQCICIGNFYPSLRLDLAHGMACVEENFGLRVSGVIKSIPNALYGGTSAATFDGETNIGLLLRGGVVSRFEYALPKTNCVLIAVTDNALFFHDHFRNIIMAESETSMVTLDVPVPEVFLVERNVSFIETINATLPSLWAKIFTVPLGFSVTENVNLSLLLNISQSPSLEAYRAYGVVHADLNTIVAAVGNVSAWYAPDGFGTFFRTDTIIQRNVSMNEILNFNWDFNSQTIVFDNERATGAAVYLYQREMDGDVIYNATARCFRRMQVSRGVPLSLTQHKKTNNEKCRHGEALVSWGVNSSACLNMDMCEWVSYSEMTRAHDKTRITSKIVEQGGPMQSDAPIMLHDKTFDYILSRQNLTDSTLRRAFGRRISRLNQSTQVGWWKVEQRTRPASLCLGLLEQWFDGECKYCSYNEDCSVDALSRGSASACTTQSGALYESGDVCPCPPGFFFNVETIECDLCQDHDFFICNFGRRLKCPPNTRAISASFPSCFCDSGFYRTEAQECLPCPLNFWCPGMEREYEKIKCSENMVTIKTGSQNRSSCLCGEGLAPTALQVCDYCPVGFVKNVHGNDTGCEKCPENMTSSYSRTECICDAGFYSAAKGDCLECPPGYACLPADEETPRLCTEDNNEEINATTHGCQCIPGFMRVSDSCVECPVGFFCHSGAYYQCPVEMTSPGSAFDVSQCFCANIHRVMAEVRGQKVCTCNKNEYYVHETRTCETCPAHSTSPVGSLSVTACQCDPGFVQKGSICVLCPIGHYCLRNSEVIPCPLGSFGPIEGLYDKKQCLPCKEDGEFGQPGQHSPAICSGEFMVLETDRNTAQILNMYNTDITFDVDRTIVASLNEELLKRSSKYLHSGIKIIPGLIPIAPKADSPGVSRVRLTVEMLPEFVTLAFHGIMKQPNTMDDLIHMTKEKHILAYAVLSSVVFCQYTHDIAASVTGHSDTSSSCQIRFSDVYTKEIFETGITIATNFLNSVSPLTYGQIRSNHETSQFIHDMRTEMRLFGTRIVVLPYGMQKIIVTSADFRRAIQFPSFSHTNNLFRHESCVDATRSLASTCDVKSLIPQSVGFCSLCKRGKYRENEHMTCVGCKEQESLDCKWGSTPCCGNMDTECLPQSTSRPRCRDGIHNVNEECDPTDSKSLLAKCCTFACKIHNGYYSENNECHSVCGDGILANFSLAPMQEECDDIKNTECDMSTCMIRNKL